MIRALPMLAIALALAGCLGADIEHDVHGTAALEHGTGFEHWIFAPDNKTVVGAAFDRHGYDIYSGYLLPKYGGELKPPRAIDYGVTVNGTEYDLSYDACLDYGQMAGWDRSNEHPKKTLLQKIGL